MFNLNTTIILGAGASVSYGYPLGNELIDKIIQFSANYTERPISSKRKNGIKRLHDTLVFFDPISIDAFLFHYRDDTELIDTAKIVISTIILNSANKSLFSRITKQKHWLRFLWDGLIAGRSVDELISDELDLNFNIITFNYDATVEYFLYSRVMSELSMFNKNDRKKFLDKLKSRIHHVYGCVMDYQWMGGKDGNNLYGDLNLDEAFKRAIKHYQRIHLINERSESDYTSLQNIIQNSSQVTFLGFGFDETNIGNKV